MNGGLMRTILNLAAVAAGPVAADAMGFKLRAARVRLRETRRRRRQNFDCPD